MERLEHPLALGCRQGPLGHRPGPRRPRRQRFSTAALAAGTLLEINANPNRRDIDEASARAADDAGLALVINTDSHRTAGFAVNRFGVATARRAGLRADQIANTRPWAELKALLPRYAA